MNFKPGDPVWCLVDLGHPTFPAGGWVAATIVGPSQMHRFFGEPCWQLDIQGGEWHSQESRLRPRDPPREDLRVVSWDSCLWRPKVTA